MKKFWILLNAIVLAMTCLVVPVKAADDYSDTAYWTELCTKSSTLSSDDIQRCKGYREYVSSKSDDLKEQLAAIDAKKSEISSNLNEYIQKIADYQSQIEDINAQIEVLNGQIEEKQKDIEKKQQEIEEQQKQIDEKNAEVEELKENVSNRIENSQSQMRVNKYIDILMGAKTFTDFIRIANGLKDITNYNRKSLIRLNNLIVELNAIKEQMEADKAVLEQQKQELETAKSELEAKSAEVLVLRYEAEAVKDALNKELEEQNTNAEMITSDISDIQATMKSISDELDRIAAQNANANNAGNYVPTSSGLYHPCPGVHVSAGAGSFRYGSGAIHLGADYGAGAVLGGTPVYAVGNGVVLYTHDGCPTGFYGSSCGAFSNKSQRYQSYWAGGGNQIVLLFVNDGGLYAAKYYHLYAGSLRVSVGSVVSGGQQLALIGSSGSSTGAHLHIELFYLGNASQFSSFAQTWDGELEFHTGWGSDLYYHLCDQGAGAPCKIHPESVFGW